MKTFKILTLGCKVNQYESELMRRSVMENGFIEAPAGECADIYVINTCTVTQSADHKSRHVIRKVLRDNPKSCVVVTGCYTEFDSDLIKQISPGKILIIKNKDKSAIVTKLKQKLQIKKTKKPMQVAGEIFGFKGHTRAFLKVQDGCNNRCSYCKVPLVRGKSRSRSLKDVYQEAQAFVKGGHQEIVLTGICLGAYGRDLRSPTSLSKLIAKLHEIEGLKRIRLSSIEVTDLNTEFLSQLNSFPKLCHHFHIPLQSADSQVLAAMKRNYTFERYRKVVQVIRQIWDDFSLTTDVMVGFPAETSQAFLNTVSAVKELAALKVHIFPYSPRIGTVAANKYTVLPSALVKERAEILEQESIRCSKQFQAQFIGKTCEVLFENKYKSDASYWQGHTDNFLEVIMQSKQNLHNQMVFVLLQEIKDTLLLGIKP